MSALNLSLGTYACPLVPLGQTSPVQVLEGALVIWLSAIPNAPVFTAAGNEDLETPFWPAAMRTADPVNTLPTIEAINALDQSGAQVVWDQIQDVEPRTKRSPLPTSNTQHDWANGAAPGVDLIGVGGADALYRWSGSSFASPIAAALKTTSLAHTDVDGLHFISLIGDQEARS